MFTCAPFFSTPYLLAKPTQWEVSFQHLGMSNLEMCSAFITITETKNNEIAFSWLNPHLFSIFMQNQITKEDERKHQHHAASMTWYTEISSDHQNSDFYHGIQKYWRDINWKQGRGYNIWNFLMELDTAFLSLNSRQSTDDARFSHEIS